MTLAEWTSENEPMPEQENGILDALENYPSWREFCPLIGMGYKEEREFLRALKGKSKGAIIAAIKVEEADAYKGIDEDSVMAKRIGITTASDPLRRKTVIAQYTFILINFITNWQKPLSPKVMEGKSTKILLQLDAWKKGFLNQDKAKLIGDRVNLEIKKRKIRLGTSAINKIKRFLAVTAIQRNWNEGKIDAAVVAVMEAVRQFRPSIFSSIENEFARAIQDAVKNIY